MEKKIKVRACDTNGHENDTLQYEILMRKTQHIENM